MSEHPLISILTSVYNCGDFIKQAINSVLKQTYDNWEWIIIDDGSTDNTKDILQAVKDKRINCVYQDHRGFDNLTKTFNKALDISKGDLIAMLDGDDYWVENKLEVQVKRFQEPDIILCYGEGFLINKRERKIGYWPLPTNPSVASNNPKGSALRELLMNKSCFLINSTVMVRKRETRLGSSLEKSVYPQAIDFQKNHTELKGYAEAWTSSVRKQQARRLNRGQ